MHVKYLIWVFIYGIKQGDSLVDLLLSLLTSSNDFTFKAENKIENKYENYQHRPDVRTFNN